MNFFEIIEGLLRTAALYAAVPLWGAIFNVMAIGMGIMRGFEIIGGLF